MSELESEPEPLLPLPDPFPLFEPVLPSPLDDPPPHDDASGVSEHSAELLLVLVVAAWVGVASVPVTEFDTPAFAPVVGLDELPFESVVEAAPALLVTVAVWLLDPVAVAAALSKLATLAALLILSANLCGADDTIVHCVKKRIRAIRRLRKRITSWA